MIVAHYSLWGAESTAIADRLGGDATPVAWPAGPSVAVGGHHSGTFDPRGRTRTSFKAVPWNDRCLESIQNPQKLSKNDESWTEGKRHA